MNVFALISWILKTPLLKVPLLVLDAVLLHIALTQPNPTPPPAESKQFSGARRDVLAGAFGDFLGAAVTCVKWIMCALAIVEAAAIVAQELSSPQPFKSPSTAFEGLNLYISPAFALGSALALSGGLVRLWCHRALGRFFTWQLALRPDHKLITSGPYALVRHPSYISFLTLIVGNILVFSSPGSLCAEAGVWQTAWGRVVAAAGVGYFALLTGGFMTRLDKEDAVLREQFGAEWEVWARKTPYRLLPYIY